MNRSLGKQTGLDVGRFLFGAVHRGLGGHLRLLLGIGAALDEETRRLFAGVGLALSEGFGVVNAASPVTATPIQVGGRPGSSGRALPDVELRVEAPDPEGVGELVARGPMLAARAGSEQSSLNSAGWIRLGRRGRLDESGKLWLGGEPSNPAPESPVSRPTKGRATEGKRSGNQPLGAQGSDHSGSPPGKRRGSRKPISAMVARILRSRPQARAH
jgi:AMP-binding enzyme